MKSIPITLLALALVVACATACRQTAEKVQEKAIESAMESQSGGKADVDISEGNIKIESDQGSFSMNSGAKTWPADIPADVAQPTGGTIAGVMTTETDEGKSWSMQYTGIPFSELDRYRDDLKAKGFQTSIVKSDDGGMVNGQKDKLTIMLQLGSDSGSLTVVVE